MAAPQPLPGKVLAHLLAGIAPAGLGTECVVSGLAEDSRQVTPGDLFLARVGGRHDGRDFVDQALERGAAAVVTPGPESRLEHRRGVPVLRVADFATAAGVVAHRFYDAPSSHLWVAGVTGTNGKTSVARFTAHGLAFHHGRSGVMGTLGHGLYGSESPASHTTPGVVAVHRILAEVRAAGAAHAVVEASSHGLDQGRLAGVEFRAAAFTNLSRDHLDYHGDLERYGAAKARLFHTPSVAVAVVNLDDAVGRRIAAELPAGVELWGFSTSGDTSARLRARVATTAAGLALDLDTHWGTGRLELPLIGSFQGDNLLAALGLMLAADLDWSGALDALASVRPVPGRLECIHRDGAPRVVVDYAHTPEALERVLRALRRPGTGRLLCVFGCGGERDRGKRPQMAAVAERLADRLFVTDDNPRGEDPEAIVTDILAGLERPQAAQVERDRGRAIAAALALARPMDIVLVAGKGHEDYQEIGGVRHPFSDRRVVRQLLGMRA